MELLMDNVIPMHGYDCQRYVLIFNSIFSPHYIWFIRMMSQLQGEERREFLKFISGCPRLPRGGIKNLTPKITLVDGKKGQGLTADNFLPSVMTC